VLLVDPAADPNRSHYNALGVLFVAAVVVSAHRPWLGDPPEPLDLVEIRIEGRDLADGACALQHHDASVVEVQLALRLLDDTQDRVECYRLESAEYDLATPVPRSNASQDRSEVRRPMASLKGTPAESREWLCHYEVEQHERVVVLQSLEQSWNAARLSR